MYSRFLLIIAIWVTPTLQLGPAMGPLVRLDFKKMEECPKFHSSLKVQLGTNAKGQKVINAQLKLTEDFDKKYKFKVFVDKWTGSEWKKNVMTYEGDICDYINKFLPDVRKRIYESANVPGNCEIKKGTYNVKDIYVVEKEVKIPAIPYGTFRVRWQMFNPKKVMISCYVIDVDSFPM